MNKNWRRVFLWYFWTLPLAILGLALAKVYGAHSFRWNQGVLTSLSETYKLPDGSIAPKIWGKPGGQTFAWIQFYAGEKFRSDVKLRVHETAHTVQSIWFGLGGFLLYPIYHMIVFGGSLWTGLLVGGWIGSIYYGLLYVSLFLYERIKNWKSGWKVAYRANPFEVHAYHVGDGGHGWGE